MYYTEGIELCALLGWDFVVFIQFWVIRVLFVPIINHSRAPPKSPVKAVLFGNRAACYVVQEDFKRVVEDCDKSLEIDDKYSKVYLRRAQAHRNLNDFRSSLKGLFTSFYPRFPLGYLRYYCLRL
jgi:hypothetical protein